MRLLSRFSGYLLLFFLSIILLGTTLPVDARSMHLDHSEHHHAAITAASYTQTDCASACSQSARTERQLVAAKDSKRKQAKPHHPKLSAETGSTRPEIKLKSPVSFTPRVEELYRFTCALLF